MRNFFTRIIQTLPALSNQFAYRPTCSTTAALISLLSHTTSLLESNTSVFVLTFDYSKAFDTLSHSSVASALSSLDIPDLVYNWTLDYLTDRSHYTILNVQTSGTAKISAGVIQGSVLGQTLFNVTASTLTPFQILMPISST